MKWRSLAEDSSTNETRSLYEILAERKELSARYVPPETQAIHSRVIAELKERGIAAGALVQGDQAPAFELAGEGMDSMSSRPITVQILIILFFIGSSLSCPD
jgi:hypothetical protein